MKRTLALLLAALLALCAGCSSAPASGDKTPQPQVVYRPTYFDAPEEADDLYGALVASGRVYWTTSRPVDPENSRYEMQLCSFAVDGTDFQSVPLTDPAAQDEQADLRVYSLCAMPQGGFAGLSSDYDEANMRSLYSVVFLSEQGEVTGRVSLGDMMQGDSGDMAFSSYVDSFAVDGEGNLCVLITGERGGSCVLLLSPEGKKTGEIPVEDRWFMDIARMSDGRIALIGNTYDASGGYVLSTVDMAAKALTDLETGIPPSGTGSTRLVDGDETSALYLLSGDSFYALDAAGTSWEKLFSFLEMDYNPDNVQSIFPIGQEQFLMLGYDFYSDGRVIELARLEKREYAETRKILTLSTLYASGDLTRAVVTFNRQNEEYRVELTQYSELSDDFDANMDRFRADMVTGNMPDIVEASDLSFDNLAARGLFLDLLPFLDGDGSLTREDFVPSALAAMQTGDHLYFLCRTMNLVTMTGSKQFFPQETGITMKELVQLAAQHPEMAVFAGRTQTDVLQELATVCIGDLIDPVTGACSFDSVQFVDLLNLAAKAPAEIDWDNMPRDAVQIKNGDALLRGDSIYGLDSFLEGVTELGDDFAIVGLPTQNRMLAAASFNRQYAVSAKTQYPDGAWAFLSFLMTNGNARSYSSGVPVLKEDFEKHIEENSTPSYTTGENGEQVPSPLYGIGYMDGTNLDIYPATPEQAEQFRHLVDSVSGRISEEDTVQEIILEEAAPFFAGQKSAQDAAAVIQNRVQTYISENR